MRTIQETVSEIISQAACEEGFPDAWVSLTSSTNLQHGDYASNIAIIVSKGVKMQPREAATRIVNRIAAANHPQLARVEVAGPGFINVHLSDAWLAEELTRRTADPRLGAPTPGDGRTVVVDFSSPNVAKRMHLGHLRSTVIGNTIANIHQFLGWTTIRDNHVGDWGTQFGKLTVAWREWRDEVAFAADPVGEMQRLYTLFNQRAEADPSLDERARAETVRLQSGEPENSALWRRLVEASLCEYNAIYERLGVRFDVTLGESHYRDALAPLVEELLANGIAKHSQGAVVVPVEGEPVPLLVRKSDGGFLYGTTDLATLKFRTATWHPDRVIYVTDERQSQHFRQVFATARKLGVTADLVHVPFGVLRLPDGDIVAARRGGGDLALDAVLDEIVAAARAVETPSSAAMSPEERDAVAESVGTAALRFADLRQDPASDLTFDRKRALALNGDSSTYLLYAYTRCRGILGRVSSVPDVVPKLEHPTERALAVRILRTSEVIVAAALRPNVLCAHLLELGADLSRFYVNCRVLDAEPDVMASRLVLVKSAAEALSVGMHLLGIRPVNRM